MVSAKIFEVDTRTRKSIEGVWKKHNGVPVWQEVTITETYDPVLGVWNKKRSEPSFKTPEDLGFKKEFLINVVYREEFENRKKRRGIEISWFLERKRVTVRSDREHIWLLWQDGKLWIKDLWSTISFQCPLRTTPDIIVEDLDPEEQYVSEKDLAEILKVEYPKTMIFNKKDDSGDYGVQVEFEVRKSRP